MTPAKLLEEWTALVGRRPSFREALAPYQTILTAWSRWPADDPVPLQWSADACRQRWERGIPLLAEASPTITASELEFLLGPLIDLLGGIGVENEALERFAGAWDRGELDPSALLPRRGRIGLASAHEVTGLSQDCLALLAYGSLRPALDRYFSECRPHLGDWTLGACPFCGAPPAFTDLLEDGLRQLACHLCGGAWRFSRLSCPYCGSPNAEHLVRFLAEDKEEGYAISACQGCHGYLKELDRRIRWNAGSPLLEDWGSPHLDIIARQAGYWRAAPTLLQLEHPA